MFLKKITKGNKTTKLYTYYRLCESVRIGDKSRHRILLNAGDLAGLDEHERKMLANRIEALYYGNNTLFLDIPPKVEQFAIKFYKELREKYKTPLAKGTEEAHGSNPLLAVVETVKDMELVDINSIEHDEVLEVGAEWLCLQAVEELKIADLLAEKQWDKDSIATALAHLVSRAVYPASEHKTAQWLADSSALTSLLFKEKKIISYQGLYKMSQLLYEQKEAFQTHLSTKTNELFDLQDKIVLYDLTNTYFEGRKAGSKIAKFGRSKEKRSDAKLVSLALVTNGEGFVKYSKIYEGNISEPSTLAATIDSLSANTSQGSRKPVVVIDAGIATDENVDLLKEKGYDYLCVTRSKLKDYKAAEGSGNTVEVLDNRKNKIQLQHVVKPGCTDRYMYIKSEMKAVKEASMEAHFSTRYEEELTGLSRAIHTKGGTKKIDKVHERLGRIKERYPAANKHYDISIEEKDKTAILITFKRKEAAAASSTLAQGVYFIRTSLQDKDEKATWDIYNTLTEVEATFRTLKTDLSLRPVFHQKDKSTEAHIHLGVLAYTIVNTIRHKLKQQNIHHDWKNIVRIMNTQKAVTTSMKNDKQQVIIIKKCSRPNSEVSAIYQAMKYKPQPFTMKKFVLPQ
jgi:transposase